MDGVKTYIVTEPDLIEICRVLAYHGNPQLAAAFDSVVRSMPAPPCKQQYSDCPIRISENAIRNATLDDCLNQVTLLRKQILDYMDTGYDGSSNEMKDINKMFFKRMKKMESHRTGGEPR